MSIRVCEEHDDCIVVYESVYRHSVGNRNGCPVCDQMADAKFELDQLQTTIAINRANEENPNP